MRERNFSKLDRKKLPYEDIVKFKWKTIQYLVDNKKPQMEMLTKNMKQLIQEVKYEMRRKNLKAFDIEDFHPDKIKETMQRSIVTKRVSTL